MPGSRRTQPAPVITHLPEIGVTAISKWIFNCYVIHDAGDAQPVVVDLGMPSQLPLVSQELHRHGSAIEDLAAAVATHGHLDHVGGLPALRARAAPKVYLPETIAELRAGTRAIRSPGPRQVAQILPVIADQPRDFAALKELAPIGKQIGYDSKGARFDFEPDGWLRDDVTLPAMADWEVLHTPGHSDDSTCLYHAPTRTLLSGDSVLSIGGRGWFNPEYVDARASVATEARLRGLDVEHLLPGHGRVVTGPDVMGRALSFVERPVRGSRVAAAARILSGRCTAPPDRPPTG